jgi:hypothetical protein
MTFNILKLLKLNKVIKKYYIIKVYYKSFKVLNK